MKFIGSASSHWPSGPSLSCPALAACSNAEVEIEILFGAPVEPELSTIAAMLSETVSGTASKLACSPFTTAGETKIAFLPAITSAITNSAATVSLAGTTASGLVIWI